MKAVRVCGRIVVFFWLGVLERVEDAVDVAHHLIEEAWLLWETSYRRCCPTLRSRRAAKANLSSGPAWRLTRRTSPGRSSNGARIASPGPACPTRGGGECEREPEVGGDDEGGKSAE